MPVRDESKILGMNYNSVKIDGSVVAKKFLTRESMFTEIEFRRKFESNFKVPGIVKVDYDSNTIYYEYINGKPLSEDSTLKIFTAEELAKFIARVPLERGVTRRSMVTTLIPERLISNMLVHGDFRIANMILSNNGDLYLIDFESGNYIFKEFDEAYLFISLLRKDHDKASEYLETIKKKNDYNERFVYGKLCFITAILLNPKMEQRIKFEWIKMEKETIEELTFLRKGMQSNP